MTSHTVKLEKSGIYFFRKPTRVTLRLNREILVVLVTPELEGCGVMLHDTSTTIKQIDERLSLLLKKTQEHLKSKNETLGVKLFGVSYYNELLVLNTYHWIKDNKLNLLAQDIGRNVRRNIVLDCGTGKVGVRYAENYSDDSYFLAS